MRGIQQSSAAVIAGVRRTQRSRRSGLARGTAALCVLALGCLLGAPAPAQPRSPRGAHAIRPNAAPHPADPPRGAEVPPPSEARSPTAGMPRCVSTSLPDATPSTWCLRQVVSVPGQPLRVLSWSGADPERTQMPTLELEGEVLSPLTPPPQSSPLPLALMLMVQLGDSPLSPALRDSIRAVIDATFKLPKSSLGLLAYERGRRIVVEQPLTHSRDEVVAALAQIESHTARKDGTSPSFSVALSASLGLLERVPPSRNSQTVVLALGSGLDDLETLHRKPSDEKAIQRMVRQSVVLDALFFSPPNGGSAPKYLQDIVGQSGGRILSTTALDELPSKTGQYLSQVLAAVQTTHYALPAGLAAAAGSYRLTLRAAGGATIGLSVELSARGAAEAAVPKPGGEAPANPSGTRSLAQSPLWWWLDGGLLALVLAALCVPALRRRVQAALFSEPLPFPRLPGRESTTAGGGVLTEPLPRVAVTPRAPTVGRAVEWVDAFRSPRGQTHVAWLLSSATGRVYFLEKADTVLGGDLGCDIFIGTAAGASATVSSAMTPTLTPGGSPRCRLVRDAGSGQLLVYPVDGMTVDRNGQRLNSPTYVFDQDELQIGSRRFRYFETRTSINPGSN
ncbi:MAG TPA: FHA domain-containing protein [Pseudomonadota bacterium]|nr:FHA domain-containing protein [Pseudomonadota bacterium]